jgi:hypothetical protein
MLLAAEPLFAAVLADEPELRKPLHTTLLNAFQNGQKNKTVQIGQRLLNPRL